MAVLGLPEAAIKRLLVLAVDPVSVCDVFSVICTALSSNVVVVA